jgi:hypothetical protein
VEAEQAEARRLEQERAAEASARARAAISDDDSDDSDDGSYAGGYSGGGDVRVRGYTRKDGTYVAPHTRSRPDGIKSNNRSYRGGGKSFSGGSRSSGGSRGFSGGRGGRGR